VDANATAAIDAMSPDEVEAWMSAYHAMAPQVLKRVMMLFVVEWPTLCLKNSLFVQSVRALSVQWRRGNLLFLSFLGSALTFLGLYNQVKLYRFLLFMLIPFSIQASALLAENAIMPMLIVGTLKAHITNFVKELDE
jgi:hypothetical protein